MSETRKLTVVIKAKDVYTKTMAMATKAIKKFGRVAKTVFKAGVIAATAFTTALILMTKKTANLGDEFQKMSLRTGVSTQALSELKHAAEISGASIEDVEKGLKTLSKRMLDADNNLSTAVLTFKRLGIEVTNSKGQMREADDVFMDAVGALNELSSATEQSALAQELLGKAGPKLLPLIKSGTAGIAELREEAERLGITFSQLEADQAAEFNDTLLRMRRTFTGLANSVGKTLIPIMTKAMKRLTEAIVENRDWLVTLVKEGVVGIIGGLGKAIEVLRFFHNGWLGLKIVGNAVAVVLSDSLRIIFEGLRMVLLPLDLIFQGLVKLGAISSNPFDKMEEALGTFQVTSREVLSDVIAETMEVNARYDAVGKAVTGFAATLANLMTTEREKRKETEDGEDDLTEKIALELAKRLAAKKASEEATAAAQKLAIENAIAYRERLAAIEAADPGVQAAGEESEFGREIREMQANREALLEFHFEKIALMHEMGETDLAIHQATLEAKEALDAQAKQRRLAMASSMASALVDIASSAQVLMGKKSKTALKVMKGVAIAQAVMSGWVAAVEAWKSGMSVGGPWAPAFAVAFTAASLLKTGALIKKIGGSQGTAGGGGGVPSPANAVGDGSTLSQSSSQSQPVVQPPAQLKVEIHTATGDVPEEAIDRIVEGINLAFHRNVNINFADNAEGTA